MCHSCAAPYVGARGTGGHTRSTCAFGRKSRSAGTGKIFFRNDQLTMARASPCQLIVRDRGMKNRRPRPAWRAAGARAETRCAERDHGVAGANAAHISAHAITSCDAAQISPMHWIFHARRRFVERGARCALFMLLALRRLSRAFDPSVGRLLVTGTFSAVDAFFLHARPAEERVLCCGWSQHSPRISRRAIAPWDVANANAQHPSAGRRPPDGARPRALSRARGR